MLTCQLPWDQAIPELSIPYKKWTTGGNMVHLKPWSKIDNTALCMFLFLFIILNYNYYIILSFIKMYS